MALLSAKSTTLPSKGKALDIYYCTDTKETFLVAGDGLLLNARDILQGTTNPVRAVGPQGPPGRAGDKGADGLPGPAGNDGRDSTVPGPQGAKGDKGADGLPGQPGLNAEAGAPGPRGEKGADGLPGARGEKGDKGDKGERGDVTVVGNPELLAAVEKLRAQKAALQASLINRIAGMGDHPVYRIARLHLESILGETRK